MQNKIICAIQQYAICNSELDRILNTITVCGPWSSVLVLVINSYWGNQMMTYACSPWSYLLALVTDIFNGESE